MEILQFIKRSDHVVAGCNLQLAKEFVLGPEGLTEV